MVGESCSTQREEQDCKQNFIIKPDTKSSIENLGVTGTIILKTGRQKVGT
jgi:hypothetical protein